MVCGEMLGRKFNEILGTVTVGAETCLGAAAGIMNCGYIHRSYL